MPTEKPAITIIISTNLEKKINRFWHREELRNRSVAVRKLLEWGLERYEIEKNRPQRKKPK